MSGDFTPAPAERAGRRRNPPRRPRLAACGSDDTPPGFSQSVKGERGSESSVRFGADAVSPDSTVPPGSGVEIPSVDPESSNTTTTTSGF